MFNHVLKNEYLLQMLLRDYLDTEITPNTLAMALTEELDYHKDHLDTVFKITDK